MLIGLRDDDMDIDTMITTYNIAMTVEEQRLEALVDSLDKTCRMYKMDISAEKTRLITNITNGIQRKIKVRGQNLGTVTGFRYLPWTSCLR